MKLNIGGFDGEKPGFCNMGLDKDSNIFHDLNVIPYPLWDGTVDEIYSSNTLEHLKVSSGEFYAEIKRMLKPYGIATVKLPNTFFLPYRLGFLFGMIPKYFIHSHRKIIDRKSQMIEIYNSGLKPLYKYRYILPLDMFRSHITLWMRKVV